MLNLERRRLLMDLLKGIVYVTIFQYIFVYLLAGRLASATDRSWWEFIWWPWGPSESTCWLYWTISPAITMVVALVVTWLLSVLQKRNRLGFTVTVLAILFLFIRFLWSVFTLVGMPLLVISVLVLRIIGSQSRSQE